MLKKRKNDSCQILQLNTLVIEHFRVADPDPVESGPFSSDPDPTTLAMYEEGQNVIKMEFLHIFR